MRRFMAVAAFAVLVSSPALAKDLQFWNQTTHEFSSVRLAPAGSGNWGGEQTANDPDGAVSADERLKITGVTAGKYDVKLSDKKGFSCVVSNVEVKAGGKVAFAIDEQMIASCK